MKDILFIIMSGLLVYIIGYPLVEWFHKIKDEMEEEENESK